MSRHVSNSGFLVRALGSVQATGTHISCPQVQCLMGVRFRSYKTTVFVSPFVVHGHHTLLHVVGIAFEVFVSNSVVSAVCQVCNVHCGS